MLVGKVDGAGVPWVEGGLVGSVLVSGRVGSVRVVVGGVVGSVRVVWVGVVWAGVYMVYLESKNVPFKSDFR
jgi:hypothetical protein